MTRAGWIAPFAVVACAACKRLPPGSGTPILHACALVNDRDAGVVVGTGVIRDEYGPDECIWRHEFPDNSSWSLRLKLSDRSDGPAPVIIVTRSEITNRNVPPTEPGPDRPREEAVAIGKDGFMLYDHDAVRIHWFHGDTVVELELTSTGSSALDARPKRESLKQIAEQVEVAISSHAKS